MTDEDRTDAPSRRIPANPPQPRARAAATAGPRSHQPLSAGAAGVIILGVVTGALSAAVSYFCGRIHAASAGLMLLLRWAWALALAAVFLLAGYNLWIFSMQHREPRWCRAFEPCLLSLSGPDRGARKAALRNADPIHSAGFSGAAQDVNLLPMLRGTLRRPSSGLSFLPFPPSPRPWPPMHRKSAPSPSTIWHGFSASARP